MRYFANTLRVLVGILFIFSGWIKANDPTGFSYKLDEYFSVFAADLETQQDSLIITINTLDGVEEVKLPIVPARTSIDVESTLGGWSPVPNQDIPIHTSEVTISAAGHTLYNTILSAVDSNETLLDVEISFRMGDDQLKKEHLVFTSFASAPESLSVDVSSYIKEQPWTVDFFQWLRNYALGLAVFIAVFEIVLGFALLIGFIPKLSIGLSLAMILYFAFLTFYSAYYNKVTDCGCFGDAIKLTPWQSFNKDVVLLAALLIMWFGKKHVKALFSTPFAVKFLTVMVLLSAGYAWRSYHYLPLKNYLKFKEGNNIEELSTIPEGAPMDVYENVFIYEKDGVQEEFSLAEIGTRDLKAEGYTFVDRIDKLISKGYEPEIHDFKMLDASRSKDHVDEFFANGGKKLMIVMNEVEKSNTRSFNELRDIIALCKENNVKIYALTASSNEVVDAFTKENRLDLEFYYGDKTNLKSIIRSNPGVLLFDGNVVEKAWPSTRLPEIKRLNKLTE